MAYQDLVLYTLLLQVFVDMTKKDRYPHKIKELYEAIKKKDDSDKKVNDLIYFIYFSRNLFSVIRDVRQNTILQV